MQDEYLKWFHDDELRKFKKMQKNLPGYGTLLTVHEENYQIKRSCNLEMQCVAWNPQVFDGKFANCGAATQPFDVWDRKMKNFDYDNTLTKFME